MERRVYIVEEKWKEIEIEIEIEIDVEREREKVNRTVIIPDGTIDAAASGRVTSCPVGGRAEARAGRSGGRVRARGDRRGCAGGLAGRDLHSVQGAGARVNGRGWVPSRWWRRWRQLPLDSVLKTASSSRDEVDARRTHRATRATPKNRQKPLS